MAAIRIMCKFRVDFVPSRSFVKALKRKTIRVWTVDEAMKLNNTNVSEKRVIKYKHNNLNVSNQTILGGRGHRVVQQSSISSSQIDSDISRKETAQFETLMRGDNRFGPVVTDAKSVTGRRSKGMILLEGKRLVYEAVKTRQQLKSLFFTQLELLNELPWQQLVAEGVKLFKVKPNHMQLWSDTVTSPGLMAVCKLPKTTGAKPDSTDLKLMPVTLVCDGIRDPGMLGTLIRSAVAASCSKILITRGCVDAWEPKVLRSGAGAHFYAPSIVTGLGWELITNYLSPNTQMLLVHHERAIHVQNNESSDDVNDVKRQKKCRSSPISDLQLPIISMDKVDCSSHSEVTVIVTESLSPEGARLVSMFGGHQVQLTTDANLGLLNSAISGSVALFELARQMRQR